MSTSTTGVIAAVDVCSGASSSDDTEGVVFSSVTELAGRLSFRSLETASANDRCRS